MFISNHHFLNCNFSYREAKTSLMDEKKIPILEKLCSEN